MTTRKKQTAAKKRSRSRPAKRRAGGVSSRATQGRRESPLLLAAECTAAEADALKSELGRRLQRSEPVTLDVSAVQRIDTAGLQLLAAFVRDRRTAGRAVAWRGRASALETAAGLLGLRDMLELPREAG
ncbi:MAG TPA: STAS domain-containing protein [Steroidobacteraceae bacterium]|jgi:ABC-type transporter Mla MlaB component|nr:STAS domain-containing protein [Steroidobacteraceae bacterium]